MTTENRTLPERVSTLEESYQHLATREDVADLKMYITENIARLETANTNQDARNAENFARLETLIRQNQIETIRWIIGTMIAVAALAVAAIKLL